MVSMPGRKKLWLLLSLGMNIGSLAIFKYSTFVATTFDQLAAKIDLSIRLQDNIPEFALILPVGISFYTFQSMSYTIDIYKGKLKPVHNIFHFFAYLSMFPQLVAGPIIRAKDLLKQLSENRTVNQLEIWHGIKLIVIGMFQKTVLADNIGVLVNSSYGNITAYESSAFWWISSIAFALQIFFDFSGYSLIARGLAKLMGYHFKMNFNHPYIAKSLRDFWRRWHISLSTWFRDYVYIPLGGAKKGWIKGMIFMWITMIVSGLWHGAAFTFIIWGAIHAFFLSFERIVGNRIKIPAFVNYLFVMFQVLIAWVFFRAETVGQATSVLDQMFTWNGLNFYYSEFSDAYFFLFAAILFELTYFLQLKVKWVNNIYKNNWIEIIELGLLVTACLFFRGPEQDFIYFQF